MSESHPWNLNLGRHPKPDEVSFDLERTLSSVVALQSRVPDDAFTAPILGTEREGQGVVISDDGMVLTIGYLVTEAEDVWLIDNHGGAHAAHVVGYDQETGFGLVQALGVLNLPAMPLGDAADISTGDSLIVAGQGGREAAINTQVISVREFAGSWEYVLDSAIFTVPAHPRWSGTAVINQAGHLAGIGSLYIQQAAGDDDEIDGNMIVPINLIKPILSDLVERGARKQPPRPWLGMTTAEAEEHLVVAGIAEGGPAMRAGVEPGDMVLGIDGERITGLSKLFRTIWSLGDAGVSVPLMLHRNSQVISVTVESAARGDFLKKPRFN
ncbi:MAG: S1C family serine protease [Alphaproteobacteria bacterium]|nr:S1C family serine protease [Alphaproteobacteria bacterium]